MKRAKRCICTIAVDVEGSDKGRDTLIQGILVALRRLPENDFCVSIVGIPSAIEAVLKSNRFAADFNRFKDRIRIIPATQVATMEDKPEEVLEEKPDSSVARGIALVEAGEADAFVSAGNTGVVVLHAATSIGVVEGLTSRPPIGGILPTRNGSCIVVDVGANPVCRAPNLLQFAVMGVAYAKKVLGIANLRVGLLNMGTEEDKGSPTLKRTYKLLKDSLPQFIGNVEGRGIPKGIADVVVCDGYVGNTMLKFGEGIFSAIKHIIKQLPRRELITAVLAVLVLLVPPLLILLFDPTWFLMTYFPAWALAAFLLWPAIRFFKRRFDYREYGGAPLLGLKKGVVIICHGSSNWRAIMNAIRQARTAHYQDLPEAISREIASTQALNGSGS